MPTVPSGEITMLDKVPLVRASMVHFLVVNVTPLYFADNMD